MHREGLFINLQMIMNRNSPIWFAHRGALLHKPENTLSSFETAITMGLPAIEVDVVSTKDGVVMASHNFDLERETDGVGYIHEKTYEEITSVNVLGPKKMYEKICTLKEVLRFINEDILVNIEIKTRHVFDFSTARYVLSLLKKENRSKNIIVSSFNPFVLRICKLLNRAISTGWIVQYRELLPFFFLSGADSVHPRGDLMNIEFFQYAKRKKLRINTWTINTKPAIEWLERRGVDGTITDRLEFFEK